MQGSFVAEFAAADATDEALFAAASPITSPSPEPVQ
jgi:hypothetical protein